MDIAYDVPSDTMQTRTRRYVRDRLLPNDDVLAAVGDAYDEAYDYVRDVIIDTDNDTDSTHARDWLAGIDAHTSALAAAYDIVRDTDWHDAR